MPVEDAEHAAAPVVVPREELGEIQALYDRGLYLQAWRRAERVGPLGRWSGANARILAGRLAIQLGARRLGELQHLRLRREAPGDLEAWEWTLRALHSRAGPYAALRALRRGPELTSAQGLALHASLLAGLRDFDEAERLLVRAETLAPGSAWVAVERGDVMVVADDHRAALEAADRALELRPWYRPAVDLRAHALLLLGRSGDAVALLEEGMRRLESASLGWVLAVQHLEAERPDEAEAVVDRVEELMPLGGRAGRRWLAERRSDVAALRNDRASTARWATEGGPFYRALALRLGSAPPGARRVLVQVPFVRQHHLTCVPATLAAVSRHHGVPAEHLEIADAICYDGTPNHAERGWADRAGFRTREFRVTWDAARAVLDRGLPFTLATTYPGGGHLQAVVGYDEARGTLLIRDPFHSALGEMTWEGLEEHRVTGPRGMALAPPGRHELLDGLDLPEAPLHDLYHRVQAGLWEHDRDDASRACAALEAAAPGHRLALGARRSLAEYDGDQDARLSAIEGLLALFPDDVNLRLARNAVLARLGRRELRVGWLRAELARRGHPLIARALAEALLDDAREEPEAERLARTVVRRLPYAGEGYHVLAWALWGRDRGEALLAFRVAACLEPTREDVAWNYFRFAWLAGRTDEALAFLRGRLERLGKRSGAPAASLFDALEALARSEEAHVALDRSLDARPGDGTLLLFAARAEAARGRIDRAEELLRRARGAASRADLARTAARIAEGRGELSLALERWRETAALEPLDLEAVRAVAGLLVELEGPAAAESDLRGRVERFPHHRGLGITLAEHLRDHHGEELERELRRMAEVDPTDAWTARELALLLARTGKPDEALAWAERGAALDPASPSSHDVRSVALTARGRLEEAKAELRAALSSSADDAWAIGQLFRLSADAEERRGHLRHLRGELARQVTFGDGLLRFQELAFGTLDADELLATLREARQERPELWHAWVALGRQLALDGDEEGSRAQLREASQRFPLHPRVWHELAAVLPPGDEQREALEKAMALAPGDPGPALTLAAALHGEGSFEAERAVLARALRHAPGNALLHGWYADAHLALGREEEAMEELGRALHLDPSYEWALQTLQRLCAAPARRGEPLRLAEAIAAKRPRDARTHLLLARTRPDLRGRLAALDEALRNAPTYVPAHELRVELLADEGRLGDALAAATPPWNGPLPPSLRVAAARLRVAQGDAAGARAALETLVAEAPDLTEGWGELTALHLRTSSFAEAAAAARNLVRLAPRSAFSHGQLGRALSGTGARREAEEELEKALEIDPTLQWVRRRLFEVELEDGALDRAEAVLSRAGPPLEAGVATLMRVRLAAARGREQEALAAFGACARAAVDREDLEGAAAALDARGWGRKVDALLAQTCAAPGATREAGRLMVRRLAVSSTGGWLRNRILGALASASPAPEGALGAAAEYVEQAAGIGELGLVERLIRDMPASARADVGLWGAVGYAFAERRRSERAVKWMEGWRDRQGVRPWMLLNLVSALRDLGSDAEAAEVSREAARLEADETSRAHVALLACDAALAGDFAPLAATGLPGADMPAFHAALLHLAHALRVNAEAGRPVEGFQAAERHLIAARELLGGTGGAFVSRYRREVARRLAATRGRGPIARWWWTRVALMRAGGP